MKAIAAGYFVRLFTDFLGLLYPKICVVCGINLLRQEQVLCSRCSYHLPRVENRDLKNNKISELFWGRSEIQYAISYFYYMKGSKYQNILHQLKYNSRQYIGIEMGRKFGSEIRKTNLADVDLIHCIPLHFRKLRIRGFNQSELIARGISEVLGVPAITNAIARNTETLTQTRKTRYERWENVQGVFTVLRPEVFHRKHVLLVDDVVTTGATMEACSNTILKIPETRVSIASLALTRLN